ncbi:hypothetical protein QYE76_071853 [Lolium multiflorum]|uniref:CCHC-type domain-containing protein n=1 Tax=Lolium multiflorum TaxID=4521 RepID=A0AAD8WF90_LOLMU|nr:hypothetical protein QYE76_071853 [Lolium multiflorum]
MFAMSGHARKLSDLGIVIPNQLGIHRVLQSLPPSYKNFVMNYNMQNMNKELPELFSMLKSAEVEIQKEHQVLMVNKTTKFKKQGKPKKDLKKGGKKAATHPEKPKGGPKPDTDCYYCNGKGHWKRNCSKYLADLKSGLVKKKKGSTPPPVVSEEEKNVFEARAKVYSQVQCAILCSLEAELQKRFEHHDPCDMMRELKVIFETHAAVESYEASKQFFGCMMEVGSSVSEHMFAMSGHARKDLGIVIPNQLGIHRVLQSLPLSYKNFVMNYNMQNMNKELPELFSMLKSAEMEGANTKFYQLGNGGDLVFERDLDAVSEILGRPHPEFHGVEIHDQPGGELQWVITADLRGKMEPPTSERILFSIKESNWLDGLARALQEALARVCGQHVTALQGTRFAHFARHDTIGEPMALSSHPVLKYHVEHLDFMLHETQKELDNARVYANQTHMALAHHADEIKMLAKDRKSLRLQRAKKDATIARLSAKIVSLEATFKAQEDQLREMEHEGEDIQGGGAFLSDDEDFEEDENTDVEDYEFLEAGEDDYIPIDIDDEE